MSPEHFAQLGVDGREGRSRPRSRFFDTRQLVVNIGTTILAFLMVFRIQNAQNRDGVAIQA